VKEGAKSSRARVKAKGSNTNVTRKQKPHRQLRHPWWRQKVTQFQKEVRHRDSVWGEADGRGPFSGCVLKRGDVSGCGKRGEKKERKPRQAENVKGQLQGGYPP